MERTAYGPSESSVHRASIAGARRTLLAIELITAAAAVVGGLLLVVAPDGRLLAVDSAALTDSPFTSWRVPGLLLASLVGGGFALAAAFLQHRFRYAAEVSAAAGTGLVAFEISEWIWLGFQMLELLFILIALLIVRLALKIRT